jgi:putative oxidoreductase
MFKKLSYLESLFPKPDVGLLLLRFGAALPLFLKHGIEKIVNFSQMAQHFPDPLHMGMLPTFIIAWIADVICALLVMMGLATRWAALYIFGNLFVAWAVYRHFMFWTRENWHGEMVVVYMGAFFAIIFAGPGKYSLDALLRKNKAQ